MDAERERKVVKIKDDIEQGSYRVDPTAVADAIVRRIQELAAAGRGNVLQPGCRISKRVLVPRQRRDRAP
jgi:hypothetical protein